LTYKVVKNLNNKKIKTQEFKKNKNINQTQQMHWSERHPKTKTKNKQNKTNALKRKTQR
jgi:hypothetical protein